MNKRIAKLFLFPKRRKYLCALILSLLQSCIIYHTSVQSSKPVLISVEYPTKDSSYYKIGKLAEFNKNKIAKVDSENKDNVSTTTFHVLSSHKFSMEQIFMSVQRQIFESKKPSLLIQLILAKNNRDTVYYIKNGNIEKDQLERQNFIFFRTQKYVYSE